MKRIVTPFFSRIAIICFILLQCGVVYAQQTIAISGVVLEKSGKPLPGATIVVKGSNVAVTSDKLGLFDLKKSPI